ncbi:hypothetical protein RRG08_019852 [Elysia crispata]|uniref:Uncharacterized protein n=1 Tax=Elysia crispata TaxID=231223 RepID=A0AAE0ZW40_9GAST|nr:hypothetical protein RRG08_019852 [Elysia crispata]
MRQVQGHDDGGVNALAASIIDGVISLIISPLVWPDGGRYRLIYGGGRRLPAAQRSELSLLPRLKHRSPRALGNLPCDEIEI